MKPFIAFVIVLVSVVWSDVLPCPPIAHAAVMSQMLQGLVGGAVPTAASCTTANDSAFFDYTASAWTDAAFIAGSDQPSASRVSAIQFVTSGSVTITEYTVNIIGVTTGGDIKGSIYTDNTGSLDTEVAGTSVTVNITGTGVATFTLSTPKTGINGTFWLRFAGVTAAASMKSGWRNYGQTHRVFTGGAYGDGDAIRAGLYGCSE